MLDDYLHLASSGHFRNMPDHHTRRESAPDHLLIWVLAGHGLATTEDCRLQAGPGDLLTFCPGLAHEYGADPGQPWDILWVHFTGQLAPEFMHAIRQAGRAVPLARGRQTGPAPGQSVAARPWVGLGLDDELRDRWLELVAAHLPRDPRWAARTNTALCALLGLIVHRLQQRAQARPGTEPLNLHRVQSYVSRHLAEPITLAELAAQANLSPTHFARVFKRQLGLSPINYVIQKRMTQASSLLTETSMPLKQIAQAVGYNDPFYFSRLFKKTVGLSPAHYRAAR